MRLLQYTVVGKFESTCNHDRFHAAASFVWRCTIRVLYSTVRYSLVAATGLLSSVIIAPLQSCFLHQGRIPGLTSVSSSHPMTNSHMTKIDDGLFEIQHRRGLEWLCVEGWSVRISSDICGAVCHSQDPFHYTETDFGPTVYGFIPGRTNECGLVRPSQSLPPHSNCTSATMAFVQAFALLPRARRKFQNRLPTA